MATTYLSKTYGSAGNRKTMTFSFWVKRSNLGANQYPMSIYDSGTGYQADMRFASTDVFRMYATDTSGTPRLHLITNQVFRDTNAWYHIVWEIDTTQATASDRVKLYINGTQETSFSTETYPPQNTDLRWNGASGSTGGVTQVGAINGTSNFDGSMAHFHFIDGTAYDADTFGETDATTGIWKPKTAPSVTYGTNGFFLKFENSGAFGTDSSGNANNFTVNGTMTQTIDTPSNVFATWNNIDGKTSSSTFSNGNLKTVSAANSPNICGTSTLGASQGKYYYEIKLTTEAVSGEAFMGVGGDMETNIDSDPRNEVPYYAIRNQSGIIQTGVSQSTSQHPNFSAGDIIGFGLDLDNNRLYISKNGNWWDSTTTFSGSTPTSYISLGTGFSHWRVMVANVGGSSSQETYEANFGNGYFGTTAVSSAQNPDDGIGIFEYDVPTGYYALNTKAINAQEYD